MIFYVYNRTSVSNDTITTEIRARFFSISGQTHEYMIYTRRQRTRTDIDNLFIVKHKLTSICYASSLLLSMTFVIT